MIVHAKNLVEVNLFFFFELYVDDILLARNNIGLLHKIKWFITKKIEMIDLGNASFGLEIQILRDCFHFRIVVKEIYWYALDIFSMKDNKLGYTHVSIGNKFSIKQCPTMDLKKKEMHKILNTLVIRSLIYTQVSTSSNIAFFVGVLGRYMCNLDMKHYIGVKHVMRYL